MNKLIAKLFIALSALGAVPSLAVAATSNSTQTVSTASSAYYRVPKNSIQRHQVYLRPGMAEITISGDGDTDLDLYIYNGYGDLIAYSEGYSDDESVYFNVFQGGSFTVKVVNRGSVYNEYQLSIE